MQQSVGEEQAFPPAIPIKKFIANANPPPVPVVDPLIPRGITVLIGAPGGGKTHIANELARAIGLGALAFGRFHAERGAVLFIEEEHHEGYLAQRFTQAGMQDANVHVIHAKNARLDVPKWVDWIAREVERTGAILCILDPFADLHEQDESNNAEMQKVTKGLKSLKKRCPVTAFLVIHHPTKGASKDNIVPELGDGRGAGRIVGMADAVYGMACKERTDQHLALALKCRKRRDGAMPEDLLLTLSFTSNGNEWEVDAAPCTTDKEADMRERFIAAFRAKGPFRNKEEAKKAVSGNAALKSRVLKKMIADGVVVDDKEKRLLYLAEKEPIPQGPAANENTEK